MLKFEGFTELNISSSEKFGLANSVDYRYLLNQFIWTFSCRGKQSQMSSKFSKYFKTSNIVYRKQFTGKNASLSRNK